MIAWLIIGSLATFRLSYMLVKEEGPFGIFAKMRNTKIAFFRELLECIFCTSIWVAAIVSTLCLNVHWDFILWVLLTLAYSAGGLLIYTIIKRLL